MIVSLTDDILPHSHTRPISILGDHFNTSSSDHLAFLASFFTFTSTYSFPRVSYSGYKASSSAEFLGILSSSLAACAWRWGLNPGLMLVYILILFFFLFTDQSWLISFHLRSLDVAVSVTISSNKVYSWHGQLVLSFLNSFQAKAFFFHSPVALKSSQAKVNLLL